MFVNLFEPDITVPAVEGEVFQVLGSLSRTVTLLMKNLDAANTLTYRFQYSDDASSWTDVAANTTLAPGATSAPIDLLGHPFFRLMASGNLTLAVQASGNFPFNDQFAVLAV